MIELKTADTFMLKRRRAEADNQSSFVKKAAFIGVVLQSQACGPGVGTGYDIDHEVDSFSTSANIEIV